jgi:hypothetical protein
MFNGLFSLRVTLLVLVALLLGLLVAGCGDGVAPKTISGHGLSIELPEGWQGRVSKPGPEYATTLRAANFRLPVDEDYPGPKTGQAMGKGSIVIDVNDLGPYPSPGFPSEGWVEATLPIAIGRSDFGGPFEDWSPPGYALRNLVVGGRALMVGVGFGTATPSDELLAEANRVLATLRVGGSG